jgi:glycerophosphoryl diester phosphodiesterase
VTAVAVLAAPHSAVAATSAPLTIGHRGGAGARHVENTMRAYAAGAAVGGWLEADVRFTADDVPVMLHDDDVSRTTNGRGSVAALTVAKVRALRTSDHQPVPTFAQFANFLKTHRKKAFVELKLMPANPRQWAAIERAAAPAKRAMVIYSMFPSYLAAARQHGFQTALFERSRAATPAAIKAQGNFYFRKYSSMTKAEVSALKKLKVNVVAFTPDSPAGWKRARDLGAWGVLTDDAATYAAWRS